MALNFPHHNWVNCSQNVQHLFVPTQKQPWSMAFCSLASQHTEYLDFLRQWNQYKAHLISQLLPNICFICCTTTDVIVDIYFHCKALCQHDSCCSSTDFHRTVQKVTAFYTPSQPGTIGVCHKHMYAHSKVIFPVTRKHNKKPYTV